MPNVDDANLALQSFLASCHMILRSVHSPTKKLFTVVASLISCRITRVIKIKKYL